MLNFAKFITTPRLSFFGALLIGFIFGALESRQFYVAIILVLIGSLIQVKIESWIERTEQENHKKALAEMVAENQKMGLYD